MVNGEHNMYRKLQEQLPPPVYQGVAPTPPLHFYFYDDITDPVNYCEIVYTLDHASQGDIINLHFATDGGSMESAIVILHAIMRTNAHVVGYADGGVASAGTILFLACHEHVVSPFSHFLFHDGSYGSNGMKFNESVKQANAISELYSDLAYTVYGEFFDDIEIERILEGIDCYQTSAQMVERIVTCIERQNDELDAEDNAITHVTNTQDSWGVVTNTQDSLGVVTRKND